MGPLLLFHLLRTRRALAARDSWTRDRLLRFQSAALRKLRGFAVDRSPFYRRLHAGLADRPLGALPIVTKAELMGSFDEVSTDRSLRLDELEAHLKGERSATRFRGRYWIASTSGTTGRRGVFPYSSDEWRWVLASYARANDWAGLRAGLTRRLRMAVVSSRTPWHQSSLVGATLKSPWVPTLRLDATDPLPSIVEALNAFKPESLVAYASMAALLAREQRAGRLKIAPRAVFCSSEVLTGDARTAIAAAWGSKPFEVYAATETAGIASECAEHCGMHFYEDLVITEVVDKEGAAVPAGTFGARILVTVLFSRTIPLIRYEMSDSVRLSDEACPCGLPFALLGGIQGRAEDIVLLPGGAGGLVSVHPNVFHRALERAEVAEWQVVQEGSALRILVVAGADFDAGALQGAVERELRTQGASASAIAVERLERMPRTGLGKVRLVVADRTVHAQ